jgi:prolyl-tRNA synthetase
VLVVGRGLKDGVLELKDRASGSSEDVPRDGVAAVVAAAVRG